MFHFYFLNMDISANIIVTEIKFSTEINNIHTQGTVSQIFYLGLSFYKKKHVFSNLLISHMGISLMICINFIPLNSH